MARIYICGLCKGKIVDEEPEIYFIGKTKKVKKRAHKKCLLYKINKDKIYELLYKTLGIPGIEDNYTKKQINELYDKYNYEVMADTIKVKKDVLKKYFDRGWAYTLGIIKNQLPISHSKIKKEKKINKLQKQLQKQVDDNDFLKQDIDTEYQSQNNKYDISDILT